MKVSQGTGRGQGKLHTGDNKRDLRMAAPRLMSRRFEYECPRCTSVLGREEEHADETAAHRTTFLERRTVQFL